MDRPVGKEFLRKQRLNKLIIALLMVIAGVAAFVFFPKLFSTSVRYHELTKAVVFMGDLETTVSTSGIVVPVYEEVITSPINSKLNTIHLNTGDAVNIGDSVLQLDTEYELAGLTRLMDEKELKLTRLVRYKIEIEENETNYNTAKKIKELEVQGLKADYTNEKNISHIGGSPLEVVEKARTAYEISLLQLEQLNEQNRHKKRMDQSQIKELELDIKLSEAAIAERRQEIERSGIRAGNKGVITWLETRIGSSIAKGQQLARISDLSNFKIESAVTDANAISIRPGIKVIIKSNDYTTTGKVEKVIPSVENASIKFTIVADSAGFKGLRLNQKVEVYLVTSFRKNCLLLKNGPYYSQPGTAGMFVIKGNKAIKHLAELGECNYESVEILSGLQPDDEVIIDDMKPYLKLNELNVKR